MPEFINLSRFNNSEFDRGASKLREILWILVRSVFFMPSLPLPSSLRVWWLRRFGAVVGEGVVIRSRVNITFPWRVSIGDYTWVGEEVLILSLASVDIGSHVCLSQRAFLCTGSHDFKKTSFDLITRPVTVNDHCWVSATAFVGPGSNVPTGTMVRAGEVVTSKTYPRVETQD